MVLRWIVVTIGLVASLSACGPRLVGVSAPIPVDSIHQPQVPPPPQGPPQAQTPETFTVKTGVSELMQDSVGEGKVDSILAVEQQPSGSELSHKIIHEPKRVGHEPKARVGSKQQPDLVPGSAVYQIPSPMVENQSSPVDLWIDASMTVDDLIGQLKRFLMENVDRAAKRSGQPVVKSKSLGETQIVGKEVLIGRKMYAELTGPDFEIQPPGLQGEVYIEGRSLRWSWLVKPKRASKDGLLLEIRVMADPGKGQTLVETIREVVVVHARKQSWKEIFEQLDWWIKLLGGGGVGAVVVWLLNWLFLHRGKKSGRKRKGGADP